MNRIKIWLSEWSKWELTWLISATLVITALSIYWGDSLVGIASALTGVVCVILTAKGKISCYTWGVINSILYAYIGFKNMYYGEFMLNAFYYVPMQFVGMYTWKKHLDSESNSVKTRKMNVKQLATTGIISAIAVVAYGFWLSTLGGQLPYIDAITNVLSVMAMIITIKRFAEQWILWIIIDVISVGMWIYAMSQGSDNIATLLMWSVYLGNAIWGYIRWSKESKLSEA